MSARRALAEAVRVDEKALGATSPQTLEDVSALAAISPPAEAAPLLRRAAESPNPAIAGPALLTLAAMRKAAGDQAGAAVLLRRALEKAEMVSGKDGTMTRTGSENELAMAVPPEEGSALSWNTGLKIGADGAAAGALAGKLRASGDDAGAERLYREALAADQQVLGPRHKHDPKSRAQSRGSAAQAPAVPQEAAAMKQQFNVAR